jgi:hypothetical protein
MKNATESSPVGISVCVNLKLGHISFENCTTPKTPKQHTLYKLSYIGMTKE